MEVPERHDRVVREALAVAQQYMTIMLLRDEEERERLDAELRNRDTGFLVLVINAIGRMSATAWEGMGSIAKPDPLQAMSRAFLKLESFLESGDDGAPHE